MRQRRALQREVHLTRIRKPMSGQIGSQIRPGMKVRVVEKQNQRTAKLTEGVVKKILTKSLHHPHGIKVMLENGIVGRVKEILSEDTPT